jgi:hypothetical protein
MVCNTQGHTAQESSSYETALNQSRYTDKNICKGTLKLLKK